MPTALGTVASHRSGTATSPIPTTGLAGWWDADDASTLTMRPTTSDWVMQWSDKSGANRHFVSGINADPRWDTLINGQNAIRFDGGAMGLMCSAFASGFSAGELFMVNRVDTETGSGLMGGWTPGADLQHYPFTDGNIYEPWGVAGRHTLGNPTAALTSPHIYNLRSASGSYVAEINGEPLYSTATNTVGFGTGNYSLGGNTNTYMPCVIGEVVMYDRVLSTVERQQVESYLGAKWGVYISPIPTTGLIGWYDADDASTFTLTGARVTEWRDKSGNGAHAAHATAGPDRVPEAVNGRAGVYFDSAAAEKLIAPGLPAETKPFTAIAAIQVTSHADIRSIFCSSNGIGGMQWRIETNRTQMFLRAGMVVLGTSTGTLPASGATVPILTYESGGHYVFYVDGVAAGSGTNDTLFSVDATIIGAYAGGGQNFFHGYMLELIKYNRVLDNVERQQVELYLKTKWGTP